MKIEINTVYVVEHDDPQYREAMVACTDEAEAAKIAACFTVPTVITAVNLFTSVAEYNTTFEHKGPFRNRVVRLVDDDGTPMTDEYVRYWLSHQIGAACGVAGVQVSDLYFYASSPEVLEMVAAHDPNIDLGKLYLWPEPEEGWTRLNDIRIMPTPMWEIRHEQPQEDKDEMRSRFKQFVTVS